MCGIFISMNDEMMVQRLRALADPTRMRIVAFLANCCCSTAALREDGDVEGATAGEVCCHITGIDKITSTISHHLHELAGAGLIQIERRGKAMVCTLKQEEVGAVANRLGEICQGKPGSFKCC